MLGHRNDLILHFLFCFGLLGVIRHSESQRLNKAALQYSPPDIYVFTTLSNYDPYDELTTRQIMLSEYVVVHYATRGLGVNYTMHIMYYDPLTTNLTEQSLRKEYYWKYLNSTGVSPGAILQNTTYERSVDFAAWPNDVISYHSVYELSYTTQYQVPLFNLIVEYPSNTGYLKRSITVVEYSTFPLVRWRYSDDNLVSWENIVNESLSLRPAYPPPVDEFNHTYHDVSAQDLQMLENPCSRDLFAFYLIVQQRKELSQIQKFGPVTKVYFCVPIVMGAAGPDWVEMTKAFCPSHPDDCGNIQDLVMTNGHLLAASDRGIFVSDAMISAPLRVLDYLDLPLLAFHLIDPCSQVRDLFYCYSPFGINPLIHSIKLHYVPVCYLNQQPFFRDIVVVVIGHDTVNQKALLRNPLAWTVLYAEQPYTTWHLLVKAAITFDNDAIHDIKAAYYNYQLNHFDFVAQLGREALPIVAYQTEERYYVRFILPMPKVSDVPGYYEVLSTEVGDGFLPKIFPREFECRKIEVSVGSLDILFIGNQIWIAESSGRFVYLAVGHLASDVEYCSFNHPDRYFVCVTVDHTRILLGKISAYYRPYAIRVDDFPELRRLAIEESWFIPPSSIFDSKLTRFIDPSYTSTDGRVYEFLYRPILQKALKGIFFRVSYQGQIQIWYMEAGLKNDHALLPNVVSVKDYRDALSIVTGDGVAAPQQEVNLTFSGAESQISQRLDAFRSLFHAALLAQSQTPARVALLNLKLDITLLSDAQDIRPALCPFFVDAISVVLYEATMPGSTGFAQTDVGNTVHCLRTLSGGRTEETCELYISHVKFLDPTWIHGFSAVAYAYAIKSIPMHAFMCYVHVSVNPQSNDVFIYVKTQDEVNSTLCSGWATRNVTDFIGWTFYIPGQFSVLITTPDTFTLPDQKPPQPRDMYVNQSLFGKATAKLDRALSIDLTRYEGFFINMASIGFQEWRIPTPERLSSLSHEELYRSLPSWYSQPTYCLFELELLPNPVLKSSGGLVALNLDDSLSFSVSVTAVLPQGEVIMQQVLLKVSNSNPKVLGMKQGIERTVIRQKMDITIKPTGFSTGQSTITIRALSCVPNCNTPCSLTFIFQVMRPEGKRLIIQYPTLVTDAEILNLDADGNVYRNNIVVYIGIPVNYRPPSALGVNIPTSIYIYNSDPSKPMYRTTYKVSQVSGKYNKCKDKLDRSECGCSPDDKLDNHPLLTDCTETVYIVRRGQTFEMKASNPPLMHPAFQHAQFYLEKPHLLVWVEEINGREDYSLETESNSFLNSINSDRTLNRGKRYYNAQSLRFTVYGTGLYHFRVALGEFDTFDDVSGYFTVFSEEYGMDDFTFMIFFFSTLIFAFVLTLCAFLRVRKQLVAHVPIREIVDDGKVTKVD